VRGEVVLAVGVDEDPGAHQDGEGEWEELHHPPHHLDPHRILVA